MPMSFSVSGLNTGLFVRTDHVVIWSQGIPSNTSEIEVQDTSGLFCEETGLGEKASSDASTALWRRC